MSTWGHGSFENDDAADWTHEFERHGTVAVTAALEQVCKISKKEYLEAPEAAVAIAAAEIIAAAQDNDLSNFTEPALKAFSKHRQNLTDSHLPELACRGIERIVHQSELKDAWEEAEEGGIWLKRINDLSLRLRRAQRVSEGASAREGVAKRALRPNQNTAKRKAGRKLPYTEGTIFLVPLKKGGYARGVVARASPRGRVLLGYFFAPQSEPSDSIDYSDLEPSKAILRVRFGDLGLINGTWPIRGNIPNWNRLQWPTPDFVREDPLGKLKPRLVRYSDVDPSQVERQYPVSDAAGLEHDSLSGYGAVEIKLTKLLQ